MLSHRPDCRASAARPELTMPIERDPVCGMSVDPDRAKARLEHDGKSYFFCCESCATKFRAAPANFLTRDAAQAAMQPAVTTGHASAPLIQLDGIAPANALSPSKSAATAPARKPTYVCPMDPEVREGRPARVPSAAWRSSLMFRRQQRRASSTRARCIPKSFALRRDHAQFAEWRSNREPQPLKKKKILSLRV